MTTYVKCWKRVNLGMGMYGRCVLVRNHDGGCAETLDRYAVWPPGNGNGRRLAENEPDPFCEGGDSSAPTETSGRTGSPVEATADVAERRLFGISGESS